MKTILLLIIALVMLTGCASLTDRVGTAVAGYCTSTTEVERAATRERLDKETAPHRVRVECGG